MQVHPGEPARNAETMLRWMKEYRDSADLLVFPEMCIPGYLLGDMWERPAFLRECEYWATRIVEETKSGPAVVFGTVVTDWNVKGEDGRARKFNAWIAASKGAAMEHPTLHRPYGIKTLLPNYREFEDVRHFCDTRKLSLELQKPWSDFVEPLNWNLTGENFRVGIVLCEDAWEDDYAQKPMEVLAGKNPDFTLNLSSSPFTRGKNDKRHRVFGAKARLLGAPLFYVNCTGIQNNAKTLYTFDGRSSVYDCDGVVLNEMPPYAEEVLIVDVPVGKAGRASAQMKFPPPFSIGEVHHAIRYGAEKFLQSINCRKVVVGISGGIDSAVAAAVYREFLKPEELLLVNMPSRFNSETTKNLARTLAQNLGCLYLELPIEESLSVSQKQFQNLQASSLDGKVKTNLSLEGVVFENVQARDRGARLLAAIAAAFGGVFSCNTNKAEMTIGYGTLYGDIAGFLAVLGDLWKEDVYALGRHLNTDVYEREVIPEGIFTVVPSAELSSNQSVDEGKGDPLHYPYHDRLFFAFVQRWNRATPEDLLEWYLEGSLANNLRLPESVDTNLLFPTAQHFIADLERWWNLYNGIAVAKRVQAPPILAVSSRAFGFDHREFLGRPSYTQRYLELKEKALDDGK